MLSEVTEAYHWLQQPTWAMSSAQKMHFPAIIQIAIAIFLEHLDVTSVQTLNSLNSEFKSTVAASLQKSKR